MIGDDHALTLGYVARHVPPASKIGIDVAVLDIAQDFLLAHLAERGVLGDFAIFKGGTALRKLFAGAQGKVWIAGCEISELPDKELAKVHLSRIGFVFQSYNLLPVLTAEENAELTMLPQRRRVAEGREY